MMSLVIIAALFALAYVAYNYLNVKKLDEGTEKMQQIASAIRIGANAFINYEYKVIALVAAIIIVLICILISWQSAVSILPAPTGLASMQTSP